MKNNMSKAEFETATAEAILSGLEMFPDAKWVRPWKPSGLPRNAQTGKNYRGGNIFALSASQFFRGLEGPPIWATQRQWQMLGSSLAVDYKQSTQIQAGNVVEKVDEDGSIHRAYMFKFAWVYHYSQMNHTTWTLPPVKKVLPVDAVDETIARHKIPMVWGSSQACVHK